MVRLCDQPVRRCELLLRALHGRPSRDGVPGTLGSFFLCEWVEDHGTLAAIRQRRARARARPVAAAARVVLDGGLRIPSRSSFKTVALLNSVFLEANSRVSFLRS